MKKHLIAAAVAAAVAVPAMAQNVTIYGIIDKSYSSTDAENVNGAAGTSGKVDGVTHGLLSSERIGFRGDEDLGGGLKAHFVYELGIGSYVAGGTDGLAGGVNSARTQIVGLSGAFGRVNFGRDKTPSQLFAEAFTAGGANNFVGEGLLYKGGSVANSATSSGTTGQNVLSNMGIERQTQITYISPSFNGLEARVGITEDDTEATRTAAGTVTGRVETSMQDIAVYYKGIQGLNVGVAYVKIDTEETAGSPTNIEDKALQLGAHYKMGALEFFAQRFDSEGRNASGVKDITNEVNQFGVRYAVNGQLTVYGMTSDGEVGNGTTKTLDTSSYQLGALYGLSKRTTLYALLGEQKNKNASGVEIKNDGFALGVRHSF